MTKKSDDFEKKQRLVETSEQDEDLTEVSQLIRPKKIDEFIGQEKIRSRLSLFIQAAKARKEALDHNLIYGPPGLGKTTLSQIIAYEIGANIKHTAAPILDKKGDLVALLTQLEPFDVLFIDEIHRLSPQVEEVLYPAMEDFRIDIILGEGPAASSIKIDLPPFTLVGATTQVGKLSAPLRDRFGIISRLSFYSLDELIKIIIRSAQILKIEIDQNGATEIAKRARFTPRIANRLLKRVRDFAQVKFNGKINDEVATFALDELEIDPLGLDLIDKHLLTTIATKFNGGPVGISTLAIATAEEAGSLEEVIEPYLVQQGLVSRTRQGRVLTELAYKHLNISPNKN